MACRTRSRRQGNLKALATILTPVLAAFMIITGSQARPTHELQNRDILSLTGSQALPLHELQARDSLSGGPGEVNPTKAKNPTKADPGMGYPNTNVLAETKSSKWDDEDWMLTETEFHPGMLYTRLGLSNGYFGTTVSAAGPFFERDINQTNINGDIPIEGWPVDNTRQAFSTVSGFWDCQDGTKRTNFENLRDRGCESVISGLPHPMGVYLSVGNETLDALVDEGTISKFEQELSFKNGVVRWRYIWSPRYEDVEFEIEMVSFVSRVERNVAATKLSVTPRGGNSVVKVADYIDGRGGVRSFLGTKGVNQDTGSVYISVHPDGLPDVTAWVVSTMNVSAGYVDESSGKTIYGPHANDTMSVGQEWTAQLMDGRTATFEKFIGISSTDGFPLNAEEIARNASTTALSTGWDSLYNEHVTKWNSIMDPSRITSFRDPSTGKLPPNDAVMEMFQIQEIASRYILLANLQQEDGSGLNNNGVPVGGLTSNTYAGNLFWDQDFWMYPGIALTHPDYASQIINSRDTYFQAAKDNAQEAYVKEKYNFDNESSLYPWMSGRFGNATANGPALDYEYHLNAVIALAAMQELRVTGDEEGFRKKHWERVKSAVHTFMGLVVRDGDGWSIRNVTEPDEYATWKTNGAFTNAAFSTITNMTLALQRRFGEPINSTWASIAANINIDKAPSGIILEYQGMNNTVHIKQADVTLLTYPLQPFGMSLSAMNKDLAYYNQRSEPDGPAMTAAIAAVAENRIATSGCAASIYYAAATAPFLRAPWYQFSEQANDDMNANGGIAPAFPFLTANGGALQFPHFGLLGVDLGKDVLHLRPSLPMPFTFVQLGDFYFQGNRMRASMNMTHTSVTRLPAIDVGGLVDIYAGQAMPVIIERRNTTSDSFDETTYYLSMNETITVENDMYWKTLTTPGNILQCQPTLTKATNILGQYPGAINDGDPSTRFQPANRSRTAVIIDSSHSGYRSLKGFRTNWGARPASNITVRLTNSTTFNGGDDDFFVSMDVYPNIIYGLNHSESEVVPYEGNSTEYNFPENETIWSGDYSILEIEGCRECGDDEMGATVGEFQVLAFDDHEGGVQEDMLEGPGNQTVEERHGILLRYK